MNYTKRILDYKLIHKNHKINYLNLNLNKDYKIKHLFMLNYLKSFIFFYVFILGQLNPLFDLNFKILKTINLIHYLLFILFLHLTSIP